MTIARPADTSCFLPHGGAVGSKDVSSRLEADAMTQLSLFIHALGNRVRGTAYV